MNLVADNKIPFIYSSMPNEMAEELLKYSNTEVRSLGFNISRFFLLWWKSKEKEVENIMVNNIEILNESKLTEKNSDYRDDLQWYCERRFKKLQGC